jgi:hypothetical protein
MGSTRLGKVYSVDEHRGVDNALAEKLRSEVGQQSLSPLDVDAIAR